MLTAALVLGAQLEINQDSGLTQVGNEPNGQTGMFAMALARALSGTDGAAEKGDTESSSTDQEGKPWAKILQKADKAEKTSKAAGRVLPAEMRSGEKTIALKLERGAGRMTLAVDTAIGETAVESEKQEGHDSVTRKIRGEIAGADNRRHDEAPEEAFFNQTHDGEGVTHTVVSAAATSSAAASQAVTPRAEQTGGPVASAEVSDGTAAFDDGENPQTGEASARRTGRTVIEVRDYRSAAASQPPADARGEPAKADAPAERAVKPERENDGPEVRIMRFSNGRYEGNLQMASKNLKSDAFHSYLRDSLSGQIVKQSGIVLRNNDRGEIRLVLQPEHLGRVRLRILLEDNRLTGRIFVDSAFVKESFEQNMTSLYRAFKNSGFEASGFEVLLDGGKAEGGLADGSANGSSEGLPRGAAELAAKTIKQLDDSVPILEESVRQSDLVNLMV